MHCPHTVIVVVGSVGFCKVERSRQCFLTDRGRYGVSNGSLRSGLGERISTCPDIEDEFRIPRKISEFRCLSLLLLESGYVYDRGRFSNDDGSSLSSRCEF